MLYVICGRACSGKDTVMKLLQKDGYKRLISCTTRPKRAGEKEGVEYYFKDKLPTTEGEAVCVRIYGVANGEAWAYWLDKKKLDEAIYSDETYLCIADPIGALQLNDLGAYIIYIYCNTETALKRYFKRESRNENPDYKEVIRRTLADSEDFTSFEYNTRQGVYMSKLISWDGSTPEEIANIVKITISRRGLSKE